VTRRTTSKGGERGAGGRSRRCSSYRRGRAARDLIVYGERLLAALLGPRGLLARPGTQAARVGESLKKT